MLSRSVESLVSPELKASGMPDIRFECPNCGQHLAAPEELATQLIDCPGCTQTIEIPARSRVPPDPPVAERASLKPVVAQPFSRTPPGTVAFVVVFCLYLLVLVLLLRQWQENQLVRSFGGGEQPDLRPMFVWLLCWGFVGGAVGFLAGQARGKQRLGAAWGLALGPVGWLITLCSADLRP